MNQPAHVVGLDLSLTATGIAHTYPGGSIVETITSTGLRGDTTFDRACRLGYLTNKILDNLGDARLIVIEGPAYSRANPGMHDRSGLWWLVVDAIYNRGYELAVVTPTSRAKYATGKGNAGKDQVLLAVARRYPDVEVTNNNEADALVLAAMGARRLGHPIDDLPKTHLAALDAAEWPDLEGIAA